MPGAPLAAAIAADGRALLRSSGAPVAWWSFTKTLIAALAVKLAGAGRLDLDAPMDDPRYTLRQVLAHTAGLPNYGGLEAYQAAVATGEPPWSAEELLSHTQSRNLLFAPGEGWRYSNVGYFLARRRIEERTDRPLAVLLQEFLFQPLALPGSRLAQTRNDMAGLAFPPPHPYDPGWVFHGTVIGPADDAARCLHALLTGEWLTEPQKRQLLAIRPLGGPLPERPWLTTGYGLGVMAGRMEGAQAIGHSAGGPGSFGAVYRIGSGERTVSVAVFSDYEHEGQAEFEALRLATA